MKTNITTLLAIFLIATTFSQGIAVQGVARDNANAAISNTNLPFTFNITESDNTVLFSERITIRTDIFGVFSHIVSTGNPVTNTFSSVDFSEQNLRLKVSINYGGSEIEVYNQPFQYTPYAFYAANGVPTGSIIPFMGTTAPDGWLLCDGSTIPNGTRYSPLKTVLNDTRVPNLRGRFLKGSGSGGDNYVLGTESFDAINLSQYQGTTYKRHNHNSGTLQTNNDGAHGHNATLNSYSADNSSNIRFVLPAQQTSNDTNRNYNTGSGNSADPLIGSQGSNHTHTITGNTGTADGGSSKENRPNSFGVNYIIKL